MKIIFLGSRSVGKTTLIRAFLNPFVPASTPKPTFMLETYSKLIKVSENKPVPVQITEITTQNSDVSNLCLRFLKDQDIVVIVYDITNTESYDHVQEWMRMVESYPPQLVLFVGTKNDKVIPRDCGTKSIIEVMNAYTRIGWNINHIETCPEKHAEWYQLLCTRISECKHRELPKIEPVVPWRPVVLTAHYDNPFCECTIS